MKKLLTLILVIITSCFSIAQNWVAEADSLLSEEFGVYAISVPNDSVIWAIAWDQNYGNTSTPCPPINHTPKVLRSIDRGSTWSVDTVYIAFGRISFDIHAFGADTALITTNGGNTGTCTANPGSGLYMTTDGGTSWTLKTSHVSGGGIIRFFNRNDGVIGIANQFRKTSNGGNSWTFIVKEPTFLPGEAGIITSGTNSASVFGNNIYFGTNKNKIWYSTDKGNNWSSFDTVVTGKGDNATISSVAFKSDMLGLALAQDLQGFATIVRTLDGGQSWTIVSDQTWKVRELVNVEGTLSGFMGLSKNYTSPGDQVVIYSLDSGITWTVDTTGHFGAGEFTDHKNGWISNDRLENDFDAALYKYVGNIFDADSGFISSISNNLNLTENIRPYPNPFYNRIHIKSTSLNKIQGLKIFDLQGKSLKTFNSEDSIPNEIDMSGFQSGMYLIEIEMEEGSVRKKIIKQ